MNPSSATVDEDDDDEHTTIRPPFDPAEFARESERVTLPSVRSAAVVSARAPSGPVLALAPLGRASVPSLAVAADDLEWFDLAPHARGLLRFVDGKARLDEICSAAGIPVDDAIGLFEVLLRDGVIACQE